MKTYNLFKKSELQTFLNQNPIFNDSQMNIINRKTPKEAIETKTDNAGNTFQSVKSGFAKSILMLVTGGNFNFEIKDQVFLSTAKEIKTTARLTIFVGDKSFFVSNAVNLSVVYQNLILIKQVQLMP